MDTLFTAMENDKRSAVAPLAVRMRPRTLDEVVGQGEAVGEGSWLRAAIENDSLSSVILFGPAGTGKTSLAYVIAESTKATFVEVSAIGGTVSDLRREIDAAEKRLVMSGLRTILFVDEIHRFNRSQQDTLLHAVEDRLLVLVGATTENPFFEVNSALISRSRVVELHSLADDEIAELTARAVDDDRGLAGGYVLEEAAREAIVTLAGGDGRGALTTLELAAGMVAPGTREAPVTITEAMVRTATPHRALPYDKNKDMHYDIISAFIKSMRGSDPDAAVYWLARMIDGGGHRQRRSPGSARGRGRLPCRRGHRVSRMPHQSGPGRHLPGPGSEVQCRRGRHRRGALGGAPRSGPQGARLSARAPSARLRDLRPVHVSSQLSGRLGGPALSARGTRARLLLPAQRARLGGLAHRRGGPRSS